ncbi:MAG: hypothetical protein ACP5MI_11210 [Candidatus Kryptoniota bacterium]
MSSDGHLLISDAEAYLFDEPSLSSVQRQLIIEHIEKCTFCFELVKLTQEFHDDLGISLSGTMPDDVLGLAEAAFVKKRKLLLPDSKLSLNAGAESDLILSFRLSPVQKYISFFKRNPVISSSLVLAFSLMFLFVVLRLLPVSHNRNPYFARVENSVLSVYNKNGELLWQKSVPGLPDATSRDLFDSNRGEKRYLNVCDIDGTGENVVLLSGETIKGTYSTDSLYCFNSNGSLRWVTGTQLYINFKKFQYALRSRWRIIEFITLKQKQGSKPGLYVIASDVIFPFSKVMEVDSKTGRVVQSFTNPGRLEKIVIADVNRDGREEIVLGGINMAYRRACVVVLDPSYFQGAGPSRGDYLTSSSMEGSEMYYILLPLTDVGRILGLKQLNYTQHLVVDSNGFVTAKTVEAVGAPVGGSVFYHFERGMNIKNLYFDDGFRKLRHELIDERKIALPVDSTYIKYLRASVLYWDGAQFINEDNVNRNYLDRLKTLSSR